jgi:outer membrane protein TolC
MSHSEATYLEVLTAQQSLLSARLLQISDRFEGIQGVINLYRALGGGVDTSIEPATEKNPIFKRNKKSNRNKAEK